MTINTRLRWVRYSIALCFILGVLLSFRLWTGDRLFPLVPRVDLPLPAWTHAALLAIFLSLLIFIFFSDRVWVYLLLVITVLFILALDQLRWQPWVYLYVVMLTPFVFGRGKEREIISAHQLVIPGVYFWSGIHKINHNFIEGTYSDILFYFLNVSGSEISHILRLAGYFLPLIEIAIGVGLLLPRIRNVMVWIAAAMHLMIIVFVLKKTDYTNSVIVPWNMSMIMFDFLLFHRLPVTIKIFKPEEFKVQIAYGFIIIFIWILPALNFGGYWDHYLSFSLYSDKVPTFYVAVQQDELYKIDPGMTNYFVEIPGMKGGRFMDMNKWAMAELNVPFYPEQRVFRAISPYFCGRKIPLDRLIFLEITPSFSGEREVASFRCRE